MTYEEIKAALAELPPMMVEKGYYQPEAYVRINAETDCKAYVAWFDNRETSFYADKSKGFSADNPADAIAEARAWIKALPTPEAKAQTDYMRMLADAVDFGHSNNVPAEYVDPVRITQKAMTENLLTKGGE